ncbi:LysR family nitrogen assimilation transcriptional regulator [Azospirillum agricola]|uniref:LysR family transcriptional regulator n=1 Tax=Azospirillum agricola TaxID=1720247 RepID=UPI001AE8F69D|nr:LysR substrate-binding domain-containing protein [Azospirillum agricola]MBP2232891.1 LysR family nitrogen assimilation transcriptional regulator [Azospirillum agricola]
MELLELRYFVQVADLGSFSKASVKLGITQPALSRQVQKLEHELRTSLFYRHGRGVSLTQPGRKLYDVVRHLLGALAEIKEEIQDQSERLTGSVTLGLPPSICATLGAPLARRFHESYPDATLRIHEVFSGTLLEWVEGGRLDLAVLYDARRGRSMLSSPLLVENLMLIQSAKDAGEAATDDGPVPVAMLGDLRLVLPGLENGLRRVVDAAVRRAEIDLQVDMEINSVTAIKQLVEEGIGSTILPFGAVHREVRQGRLIAREIGSKDMHAMLVTATPLHQPVSKATRALLRLIHAEVAKCVANGVLKGKVVAHGGAPEPAS